MRWVSCFDWLARSFLRCSREMAEAVLCKLLIFLQQLGLTGKPEGMDGSRVEEVARYCESDVLNTYRVWLVYELFRGSITAGEHDWSEAAGSPSNRTAATS